MNRLLPIIICFLAIECAAQVEFLRNESWEEVKEMSSNSGKPIFIDFYTTWCGPCKQMDKTTFLDSTVYSILNKDFLCLKLDAEKDENLHLVKHFKINAFPTFIFSDENGELIAKEIGYKSVIEFQNLFQNLNSFLKEGFSSKLRAENLDKLTDAEFETIYEYSNFNFDSKRLIKEKSYQRIDDGEEISVEGILFLLNNFELEDRYELLFENIPEGTSMTQNMRIVREFKKVFNLLFRSAIQERNMEMFVMVSSNYENFYSKFREKVTSSVLELPSKEIRTRKLTFYQKSELHDDYFDLADSLIREYILPHTPEQVRSTDEYLTNALDFMASKENASLEEPDLEEDKKEEEKAESPRSLLSRNHSNSLKLSNRLITISEHIYKNVDELDKLNKANSWLDLSFEYIDLPEAHIVKAGLLKKMGKDQESIDELNIAKTSPYFDEGCEKKIVELNL